MTTQIPNSMLVSPTGVTGVIRGAATLGIPLDLTGNGRAMPLVAGQLIPITADIIPTIASGSVLSGVCVADYVSSGTGALSLSAYFLARGDTYAAEAARMFTVTYFVQTSGTYAIVQKGGLSATFPFFTAQSPPSGTIGATYSYTYVAPNATSFALFSGALPAGITLNTATGVVNGTPTTQATSTYLISAAGLGGTSLSSTQSVAVLSVGQVTGLTFGIPTSTTQPLTWTAPANAGSSAITDYLIEYKATSSGTWLSFAHTASTATAITLTGLTASTSYDARVSAINAGGTGAASSVVTGVTSATGTLSYITYVQPSENVTSAGYLDYVNFTGSGAGALGSNVKAGAGLISALSSVNTTFIGGGITPTVNGTDGSPTAIFSGTATVKGSSTSTVSLSYIEISLPAGTAVRHARVSLSSYNNNAAMLPILRAHLSDSSAVDLAVAIPSPTGYGFTETGFNISYNAASAGQTLRLRFELPAGADPGANTQIQLVTYQ